MTPFNSTKPAYSSAQRPFRKRFEQSTDLKPTVVYLIPHGVDVHWFSKGSAKHEILARRSGINEAIDCMKELAATPERGDLVTDHWVLHFTDQFGKGHYQKWSPGFYSMFPYDDEYAKKANDTTSGKNPIVMVDPPFKAQI